MSGSGDYISREAAIEAVKKERDYTGKFSFEEEHAWAVGFQQGITFALSDVATIPAADVRPVVRGRDVSDQLRRNCDFMCSECGAWVGSAMWGTLDGGNFKFCPNCGARMEES